ncbi:hypothetical protein ABBQ38_007824 [Trebouxia sp. C0009 RCD-2024]
MQGPGIITTLLLTVLLSTVQAAKHRVHSRRSAARKAAAQTLGGVSLLPFSSPSNDAAAARPQDPHSIQREYCLTWQPESTVQRPNSVMVSVAFHNLNFSMFCYQQHDIVSHSILTHGSWEAGTSYTVLETLEAACNKLGVLKEDAVFLDIGANIGWYLLLVAAAGYSAIAFEPMPANEQLLRRSICSNPNFQQQLTLHNDMLSDAPHSNCTMFSDEQNLGDGIVSCDQNLHFATGYSARETGIDVKTLDVVLADLHRPILVVKMDVEGHEAHVLQGATKTILEAQVPYLMFEFSFAWVEKNGGRPHYVLNSLVEAGYQFSFDDFHGAPFDPLTVYADPALQESSDLPLIYCVHKRMLTERVAGAAD